MIARLAKRHVVLVSALACLAAPLGSAGNATSVPRGSNSNSGRAFIQTNAANTCVTNYYDNVADGFIVAPPGYTPPSARVGGSSGYQFVDCV